jgi:hypothetical protein
LTLIVGLWLASDIHAIAGFLITGKRSSFQILAPFPRYFDYYCYGDRFRFLHTTTFFTGKGYPWYYPAPAMPLYRFFYLIGHGHQHWLIKVVLPLTLAMAWMLGRVLMKRGLSFKCTTLFLAVSLLCSWPLFFVLERGNLEMVLWFLVAGAMGAYAHRRWSLGACLIGFVAAFKFYPIICLALWLPKRRYKEIALGILTAVTITFASLVWIGPTWRIAWKGITSSLAGFIRDYTLGPMENLGYDHSLFSLLKQYDRQPTVAILHMYFIAAGIVMMAVFFLRIRNMPRPNQMLFVLAAITALPPTSFDYTLLNLYPAWAWLVVVAVYSRTSVRGLSWCMVLLALLCAPETFLFFRGTLYAGPLKAICLAALLALCAIYPWPELDPALRTDNLGIAQQ